MKRTSILHLIRLSLLVCLMFLPTLLRAQNISLNHQDVPLETVLKAITSQTGYKFVYANSVIDTKQRVSIHVTNSDIKATLDSLFKATHIAYRIADKQIALSLEQPAQPTRQTTTTTRCISGKLTGDDGAPLIGATVHIEGTTIGTTTDANGNYTITVQDDPMIKLVFKYLGMETRTVTVGNRTQIDLSLVSEHITIDQVVVTGYQTISKERSAGSFAIVSGSDLRDRALSAGSVLESLEGTAAGLSVNLGAEGDKFLVRGVTSINSNRSPLFIVDGVSTPAELVESLFNGNDIQSVTVLKDATAASIWGAQAANGVVVITSKSGVRGEKVKITYNGSFTYKGKPDYSYNDMMDSRMFIKNATEVFDPVGYPWESISSSSLNKPVLPHEKPLYQYHLKEISANERDAELERLSGLNGRKAYEKYMMSDAWLTNHSITLSGGNQNHTFYVSLGYQGEQGRSKDNTNEYKINVRENINLTKWMALDLTVNASYGTGKSQLTEFTIDENPGAIGLSSLPYAVFHDDKGNELSFTHYLLNESVQAEAEIASGINLDYYPLTDFRNTTQESTTANIRANAGLSINLWDGLKYEGRFSYYFSNGKYETYTPSDAYNVRLDRVYATNNKEECFLPSSGGYFQVYNAEEEAYTIRNQLSYDKIFSDDRHQLTALFGQEINQRKTGSHTTTMRGYDKQTMQHIFYDDYTLAVDGVSNPVLVKISDENYFDANRYNQNETTYRFVSFYANAAYTFDQRYSANASIRVDQSNLFGSDPSLQFKPIWSVGGVWNISREQFLANTSWLDNLSLRASYGFSGNSPSPGQGGPFNIISASTEAAYSEFGLGYVISTPANDKLTWEKTRTWNLGTSFALFGNRLHGSLDVYDKKTTDLLADSPVDPSTGYTSVLQNIGTMTNKGFELSLGSRNITTSKFVWDTDFMISYNKNKIVEMYFVPTTPSGQVNVEYAEGHPAGAIFAYQWAGLDPEDGAARIYDSQGNIIRTTEDLHDISAVTYQGTSVAPWSGSLSNRFRYKNIEMSVLFIANMGHKMRNDTYTQDNNRLTSNVHKDLDKRWKQAGDEKHTNIPSYYTLAESPNREGGVSLLRYSDIGILDASYIKLRELSVGYYLPARICRALHTQNIRIRLQTSNLWTIAFNKESIDPESFSLRYGSRYDRYKPSFSANLSIEF